jgi:hypothetical protein
MEEKTLTGAEGSSSTDKATTSSVSTPVVTTSTTVPNGKQSRYEMDSNISLNNVFHDSFIHCSNHFIDNIPVIIIRVNYNYIDQEPFLSKEA